MSRLSYHAEKQEWSTSAAEVAASAARQPVISIQQIRVLFWPLLLYCGMVVIVLMFLLGYRGSRGRVPGMDWTGSSMDKEQAVLLLSLYAAFGWTLSNGLVLT